MHWIEKTRRKKKKLKHQMRKGLEHWKENETSEPTWGQLALFILQKIKKKEEKTSDDVLERERERENSPLLSLSAPSARKNVWDCLCGGFTLLYYFTNDEESDSNGFVLTTQQIYFLRNFLGGKKLYIISTIKS